MFSNLAAHIRNAAHSGPQAAMSNSPLFPYPYIVRNQLSGGVSFPLDTTMYPIPTPADKVLGGRYDDEALHDPLTNRFREESSGGRNTAKPGLALFPHSGDFEFIHGLPWFGQGEPNIGLQNTQADGNPNWGTAIARNDAEARAPPSGRRGRYMCYYCRRAKKGYLVL
jgi:hypothetical protein